MAIHIRGEQSCNQLGLHQITAAGEKEDDTGIDFGLLKLAPGQRWETKLHRETAYVLISGEITVAAGGKIASAKRNSLFDEQAFCVHAPANTFIKFHSTLGAELAVASVDNTLDFPTKIILPESILSEHRGESWVDRTCYRLVKTLIDRSNTPEQCQLVIGEVVNFPGRWSSYPPHHHPHPEIYHYRFTDERGYGFCQLGDAVVKVQTRDTVKILNNVDHPQCAAPGYGMYYLWIIRHLPACPYLIPEFTPEHEWVMSCASSPWHSKEMR